MEVKRRNNYTHTHTHTYENHSINKGDFFLKVNKQNNFSRIFPINVSLALFGNDFSVAKNICFKTIQDDGKSNKVLQSRTEVCHQIFGG